MTPEEIKAKILELSRPVAEWMRENGVVTAAFDDSVKGNHRTFDVSITVLPLAPRIKCTLEHYGCIYMVDEN